MNHIMLYNFYLMLKKQEYETIHLFKSDNLGWDHLSCSKLQTRTYEPRNPQTITNVQERFFPAFCIRQSCLVGYADKKDGHRLVAVYCAPDSEEKEKVGKPLLEEIIRCVKKSHHEVSTIAFLFSKELTPAVKEIAKSSQGSMYLWYHVSFFREALLSHHLIPPCVYVLDSGSKESFLSKNHLTLEMLPKLFKRDPLSRFFNCSKDDVLYMSGFSPNGVVVNRRAIIEGKEEKKPSSRTKVGPRAE